MKRVSIGCAIAALAWVLLARALGPSDVWAYLQPRTISYTVDILVNGGLRWVLPVELGEFPATKPPLYNWLAVPAVAALGCSSVVAHKMPSVVALLLCWLGVVRLGRYLDDGGSGTLGWLAGAMLLSNHVIFKLGYLARPDMLLVLWLALGWVAATVLLAGPPDAGDPRRRAILRVTFWACVVLAALTKGPPAVVLPIYAAVATRAFRGSWRAGAMGWSWGVPLSVGLFGLWLWGAWRIDAEHVVVTLWREELYGRVTGLSVTGSPTGPIDFVRRAVHMPWYFLVRLAPWSVPAMLGIVALWRHHRWRELGETGRWLHGASIFVVVLVGVLSLSTGKRGDYIAPACPQAALLAAWWCLRRPHMLGERAHWLVVAGVALTLATLTVINHRRPPDGDVINRFVRQVEAEVGRDPMPLHLWHVGRESVVPSLLGFTVVEDPFDVVAAVKRGRQFWLVAGEGIELDVPFAVWIVVPKYHRPVETVVRSGPLVRSEPHPGRLVLLRVN